MSLETSKYSFVKFDNSLENVVLPAYDNYGISFQALFSQNSNISFTNNLEVGICNVAKTTLLANSGTINKLCQWIKLTGLDFNPSTISTSSFPITVLSSQLIPSGIYAEPKDLYLAISTNFNLSCTSNVFLNTCQNIFSGPATISCTDKTSAAKTITISDYLGLIYINIPDNNTTSLNGFVNIGACFRYYIKNLTTNDIYYSNVFIRELSNYYLTKISYTNNESAYGFFYPANTNLENSNYLHLDIRKYKYPEKRNVYKKSNGEFKVLSSTIEREAECLVNYTYDELHQCIVVALSQDNVHFKNRDIDSDVFKKDDYEIQWLDNNVNYAQAKFKVLIPFEGRNSNCEKQIIC
jgi:hypothetical protein